MRGTRRRPLGPLASAALKPALVMHELMGRLQEREDKAPSTDRICRGTLLSRQQYLHETNVQGYLDAREFESKGWAGDRVYPVKTPGPSGERGQDDAHRGGR